MYSYALNGPFAEFFSKAFLNKSPKISLLIGNIKCEVLILDVELNR